MKTKKPLIPVLAIALAAALPAAADARDRDPLVTMAHEIEDIAIDLKSEFRQHFRHSGAYRHLMVDIGDIIDGAVLIDERASGRNVCLRSISADLAELEEIACHAQDVVNAAERGRYSGRIDGCIRHVHKMLKSLDCAITDMQDTVVAMATPPPRRVVREPVPVREVVVVRPPELSKEERTVRAVVGIVGAIIEAKRSREHCRH